jgi:hypothetical protein
MTAFLRSALVTTACSRKMTAPEVAVIRSLFMLPVVVALVGLVASCPSLFGPDEDVPADDDVVVDDGDACREGGRSRGPSEPCCLAFGADACGANLFCAAFDGRTVPTCYVESTRLDGEQCDDDVHCASRACSDSGVCRASPGQPCDRSVGCADFQGGRYVCVQDNQGTDRCLIGGSDRGDACDDDDGCTSGFCVRERCASGNDGDTCDVDDDCASRVCVQATCSAGGLGGSCDVDDDCGDGLMCHGDQCSPPQLGDACDDDGDCAAVFGGCLDGACVTRAQGERCDSNAECGLLSCVDGTCDAVCTDSFRCALSGLFLGLTQECRQERCVEVGSVGEACTIDDDCARETLALSCSVGTCRRAEGQFCGDDAECVSNRCAPIVRRRCVDAAGDTRGLCSDQGTCPAGQSCRDRAADECVAP